ncbi:uncharacterized protein LOC134210019 [Armigeres subalbatus]|uniref:uncharacterized protein LOC134210019 n=1 Tax=Armigeres subalbatus TaxID=124917 RepID=UPI002ED22158
MQIIQIKLNHCETAQQLLWQSTAETMCDVAIIAEPYRVPPDNGNWVTDRTGLAAIQVMGKFPIQEVVESSCEGFVIARINGVFICSCYAPPRWTVDQFSQILDLLTDKLIGRRPVVIGGDFNAWAVEWGSRVTNTRGYILQEALAKLDVRLCNEGSVSTFRRDGRESIIDITFCSPSLMASMDWRVSEEYTHSDHQAIRYRIGQRNPGAIRRRISSVRRWKTKAFSKDLFVEALRPDSSTEIIDAAELTRMMVRACDATMPRKLEPRSNRRPAYWWNDRLTTLRAACLKARRRAQRARTESERKECREAKTALKRDIQLNKSDCYKELCREADANPWRSRIGS